MTILNRVTLGTVAIIVAAAVVYSMTHANPGIIPAPEQKTIDSLTASQPAFDTARAAEARSRDSSARVQRTLEGRERALRVTADRNRAVSDSLAKVAAAAKSAADSAEAWHQAYDTERSSGNSLRTELAIKDQRIALLIQDSTSQHRDNVALLGRISAIDNLNQRLARDVVKANECTITLGIRCPSRKQTAVAVVLAEVVIVTASELAQRRP